MFYLTHYCVWDTDIDNKHALLAGQAAQRTSIKTRTRRKRGEIPLELVIAKLHGHYPYAFFLKLHSPSYELLIVIYYN